MQGYLVHMSTEQSEKQRDEGKIKKNGEEKNNITDSHYFRDGKISKEQKTDIIPQKDL